MQQHSNRQVHEVARGGLVDKLATLLLDHGAPLDARDQDHDSTPAQWRIGEAPHVARFLLDQGAKPDIFLAAALGAFSLAERMVTEDRRFATTGNQAMFDYLEVESDLNDSDNRLAHKICEQLGIPSLR